MFREMRRKRQALSAEETASVLYRGMSGVLALAGDDGYPYAVPVSYVYDGDKICFHCAKAVISWTQSKETQKRLSA